METEAELAHIYKRIPEIHRGIGALLPPVCLICCPHGGVRAGFRYMDFYPVFLCNTDYVGARQKTQPMQLQLKGAMELSAHLECLL